jgi:hypothetical protein
MQTTADAAVHLDAQVVADELDRLAAIRQDPPPRSESRAILPQANGDQDTW